jgi:hypothetical protein
LKKITKQWEKTKFNFDVYFLNNWQTNNVARQEIGPIDLKYLRTQLNISPNDIPDPKPDSITIIFNGNYGDDKTPMTGWTIAHRFGHAMNRHLEKMKQQTEEFEEFERELGLILKNILGEVYGIYFGQLYGPGLGEVFQQIGTMKSARDKKLTRGYEFVYELIAQYLLTGTVKLQLPKVIKFWGDVYPSNRVQLEEYTKDLPEFEKNIVNDIETLIQTFVGKTLLM